MPRRLRNDAQELTDDGWFADMVEHELDRQFAEPYLRSGSLEVWPMWGHNSPEYMPGQLGPIVPLDDIILLTQALFDETKINRPGSLCGERLRLIREEDNRATKEVRLQARERRNAEVAERIKRWRKEQATLERWRLKYGYAPDSRMTPKKHRAYKKKSPGHRGRTGRGT